MFILKRNGHAREGAAGSANFSVRGLYVETNNVFVFDDAQAADLYEQAFEQAWNNPLSKFDKSAIAARWFPLTGDGLPPTKLCFSPHSNPGVSLDPIAASIEAAQSSVLFSIMEIGTAGGSVAQQIMALPKRTGLYAFGTTQRLDGDLKVTTQIRSELAVHPVLVPQVEGAGAVHGRGQRRAGQVVHNKFVVCDFNGDNPIAYAGLVRTWRAAARPRTATTSRLSPIARWRRRTRCRPSSWSTTTASARSSRAATTQQPLRLKRASEHWAAAYRPVEAQEPGARAVRAPGSGLDADPRSV